MMDFEAIDAKINRARGESRSLKTDIVAFCEEKARLIVLENHGDEVWWVYRGDDPNRRSIGLSGSENSLTI